jgi:hypothetical protein
MRGIQVPGGKWFKRMDAWYNIIRGNIREDLRYAV